MIGIYKITNKLNNKIYIGQSNNITRRFSEHQTKGPSSRIPVDEAILWGRTYKDLPIYKKKEKKWINK